MSAAGGEVTPVELNVSFFAPARPGLVIAQGWVERQGRSVWEGRLTDAAGAVLAKASSTVRLMDRARSRGRRGRRRAEPEPFPPLVPATVLRRREAAKAAMSGSRVGHRSLS